MYNNDILTHTLGWFQEAVPETTARNVYVQKGVHFEEVSEMLESLLPHVQDRETTVQMTIGISVMKKLAELFKTKKAVVDLPPINQDTDLLDALCDQIVTAMGVGYMLRYDMLGAMKEVNRSNHSKFFAGNAVFDENGKIMKGPDYSKANLAPFLPNKD